MTAPAFDPLTVAYQHAAMTNPPIDMREPRREEFADRGLLDVGDRIASEWVTAAADMPGNARTTAGSATAALATAKRTVADTARKAAAIIADQKMYPAGRWQAVNEACDQAAEQIRAELDRAEALATVARAELLTIALPPVDAKAETTARTDALMMLDRTSNVASLGAVLVKLAERGDAVGSLVTSSWGRDYLAARGADERQIEAFHTAAIEAAIEAATRGSDTKRAAAAKAARQIKHVTKAAITYQAAWGHVRERINREARTRLPL